jgi:hypothetical protein
MTAHSTAPRIIIIIIMIIMASEGFGGEQR